MEQWSSTQSLAGCLNDWQQRLTNSLQSEQWSDSITPIAEKVALGQRLSIEDGLVLFEHPNLNEVGRLADWQVGWLAGWQVGRLAGWLGCRCVGGRVRRLSGRQVVM